MKADENKYNAVRALGRVGGMAISNRLNLYSARLTMILDIEKKSYIDAKGLPAIEILSISFLPVDEFYIVVDNNEEYLIVASEDEGMNHIGVNKHGNVYLIGLGRQLYVASSLVKFIKLLLAFQSLSIKKRVGKHTDELRDTIKNIDKTAIKNSETFWSTILENIDKVMC